MPWRGLSEVGDLQRKELVRIGGVLRSFWCLVVGVINSKDVVGLASSKKKMLPSGDDLSMGRER